MRGADGGHWSNLCALPAFWTGLMYDDGALNAAHALIRDWSIEEMAKLRADVPVHALQAKFRDRTVQDIALEVLGYAQQGLRNRARLDSAGQDESRFLDPLLHIARTGVTFADAALALYDGVWNGDSKRAFRDFAY